MSEPTNAAAAPDAPGAVLDGQGLLDAMTADELKAWERDESVPERLSKAAPTGSPPVTPVQDPAPSTDGDAKTTGSDPAAPPDEHPRTKARKAQIQAEIDSLLDQRRTLAAEVAEASAKAKGTPDSKPAASSPATPAAAGSKFPSFGEWSAKPENADREYSDYLDEKSDFRFDQFKAEQAAARESETRAQHDAREAKAYLEEVEAFSKDHPDFNSALEVCAKRWNEHPTPADQVLIPTIFEADGRLDLLYHIATNPQEFEAIRALPPEQAAFALGRLASKVTGSTMPSAPVSKTAAPAPARTLRTNITPPRGDAVNKAIAENDFEAFDRLEREQEAAARKK